MNPEFKQKWMQALRSGNYKQGTGQLRTVNNEFCCLGVLCDIIDPNKWQFKNQYIGYKNDNNIWTCTLSHNIIHETNLESFCIGELIKLNDKLGYNFNQIADWIEENL